MNSPKIYHIENWEEQEWFSTGGTRAKKYIQNPEKSRHYYFKRSLSKPATANKQGKEYPHEFWSEIIAYQIGTLLGFNVLRYDIAVDKDRSGEYIVGCISESMISSDKQELIEGIKYLQGYDITFQPELNEKRKDYTFQLVENALNKYLLAAFKNSFIELLIFDTIIGNSDRHQENWAIIKEYSIPDLRMRSQPTRLSNKRSKRKTPYPERYFQYIMSTPEKDMYFTFGKRFAPIYDSGSSLGRELRVEKVQQLLDDEQELLKYISKGYSEIHWEGTKLDHFSLLKNLINSPYKEHILGIINRVSERFDNEKLENIVNNIDNLIPDNLKQYKLPDERKKLIIKIVTLRSQILKGLINEGV